MSHLKTPDFEEHILKYDFVIVTETKCDDVDTSIQFFQNGLFITIYKQTKIIRLSLRRYYCFCKKINTGRAQRY